MHLQETPAERISIAPGRSQGENRLFEEQTAGKEFWRGLVRTFLGTLFGHTPRKQGENYRTCFQEVF